MTTRVPSTKPKAHYAPCTRGQKKQLVRLANHQGLHVPEHFRLNPSVGPYAQELLLLVQRKNNIAPTARFDLTTLDLLFPERLGQRIVASAKKEIGVHEWPPGSNWGPVEIFIKSFANQAGPWCSYFASWNALQAGYNRKWLPANPGFVPSWVECAKNPRVYKHMHLIALHDARPGDLVIYNWPGVGGNYDHIGIIMSKVLNVHTIATIEGNVGSFGGQVTRLTRYNPPVSAVIRLEMFPGVW